MAQPSDEPNNNGNGGGGASGESGEPGQVRFLDREAGGPIAYRHNEVISAGGDAALAVVREMAPDVTVVEHLGPFVRMVGMPEPMDVVRRLRSLGFMAQPNHVHFHHALTANPVYGNPVYGNPVYGNPVYGNPVYGNPVYGNPVYGSPVYGNPVYGNPVPGHPFDGRGQRWSTARPVAPGPQSDELARRLAVLPAAGHPQVFVLDTGLAGSKFRPKALLDKVVGRATGHDIDVPDSNGDQFLDPAAGHGTFIAGLIGQIAPGTSIRVHRVLSGFGEGHEWDIAKAIHSLIRHCTAKTIINISFGGYVLERAHVMEWAIGELEATGAVIVASAGNDATCRPVYPAALPGVVGVGALGPDSPAAFTNYGPWVDVCAPGVDVVSTFFSNFSGRVPVGPDGVERRDSYEGWALWSGTSFAAPVVVGNLARMMLLGAPSAKAAVHRLIHAHSGMSIPNLGRIINNL